jgi:hypothetical protein
VPVGDRIKASWINGEAHGGVGEFKVRSSRFEVQG